MAKKAAAEEEKKVTLGAKEVADKLGIDPKYLRTILRSRPEFKNNDRARYEWEPGDAFLKKLPGIVKDYKEEHERKAAEKKEKPAKAPKKAAKKAAKKSKKSESADELEEVEG